MFEKKPLRAGKLVGNIHVDSVISNYKRERWVHNSKKLGKEDSLSVWYSIGELEAFFELARSRGADGVRLYFGAYDKDYPENELYAGRQTIVLVATRSVESERGAVQKDLYILHDNHNSILAYNAGIPCPPYCPHEGGIGLALIDEGENGITVA